MLNLHRIWMRQTSLDEKQLKTVAERIQSLLDDATAEAKRPQHLDVRERLKAVYDEVKRLVDELSGSPDGSKGG